MQSSSASTPPSFLPSSHVPPHALTIDPRATVPLGSSAILTPPPSAYPRQTLTPAHVPGHVSSGVSQIQHQPVPHPSHALSGSQQHQLQQQLLLHAQQNGVLHARIAPRPPQVTELPTPGQKPPTFQQERQQTTMTHSTTTTMLAPAAVPLRPGQDQLQRRPSPLVQGTDAVRLHGPQQAQLPAPPQAPTRGQQAASALPSAQRALLPRTPALERSDMLPPPSAPVPSSSSSSSSTQSRPQSQSQAQQLMQQERCAPSTIAAFKVLQPVKALLEQSWTTAIAAVQQELAAVHSEHIRAMREQHRLAEQLKRAQVERVQANRALLEMQARLGESLAVIQVERKSRLQLEHKLAEMSKKCTCGAAAVKTTPVSSLPPHLPPSTTSSPVTSSPASTAPKPATVDGDVRAARTSPVVASLPPADKPRELRREREEDSETVEGEAPPKRRRITPPPSTVPAKPAPVPEAVSTIPENAEAQKAAEAVVPSDKQAAPQPQPQPVQQQSTPPPESTPHEPESESAQEQPKEDPPAADADADAAPAPRKIGIQHIQLVYETVGETLRCRMCMLRKRELDEDMQVTTYPIQATYNELVGHCEQEHEAALDALSSMTPADIVEMHQFMLASS